MHTYDLISLISFLVAFLILINPDLEKKRLWSATATPLASIIGSGYLVSAPILYDTLGGYAPIGMSLIVLLAYLIGSAIRYNIIYEEKFLKKTNNRISNIAKELESFSSLALSFAYMVSVTFYLRLLSAFIFSGFLGRNDFGERITTTILLLFIGISGFLKGLYFLEFLEKYAVSVKLSVIFSFLTTLFVFDLNHFKYPDERISPLNIDNLRILAGILLIVQGFETSKYLGEKYSRYELVKSMKLAQLISGFIYLSFTILIVPVFLHLKVKRLDETGIILLALSISTILGYLIKLGPLMSQFSAAVADTIGAGGLLYNETRGRVSSKLGYLIVSFVGVILVWSINIFEIITYASKAFAFYYFLQITIAFIVAIGRREFLKSLMFLLLSLITLGIVIISKSAEI